MPDDRKVFDISRPKATPSTRPIIVSHQPGPDPMVKPPVKSNPPNIETLPEVAKELEPQITEVPVSVAPADSPVSEAVTSSEPTGEITPSLPGAPSNMATSQFSDLQSKIDSHPLFSGQKDARPKSRKLPRLVWPFAILLLALIIAYLAIDSGVVRGASHLPFHIFKQPSLAQTPAINTSTTKPPAIDPYAGWHDYSNSLGRFSLKYPSNWKFAAADPTVAFDTFYSGTSAQTQPYVTVKVTTTTAQTAADDYQKNGIPPSAVASQSSDPSFKISGYSAYYATVELQDKSFIYIYDILNKNTAVYLTLYANPSDQVAQSSLKSIAESIKFN